VNRSRDLPPCTIVSQQTTLPRICFSFPLISSKTDPIPHSSITCLVLFEGKKYFPLVSYYSCLVLKTIPGSTLQSRGSYGNWGLQSVIVHDAIAPRASPYSSWLNVLSGSLIGRWRNVKARHEKHFLGGGGVWSGTESTITVPNTGL
jgi:hypothetical protein